jgi:hypothetical protein
LAWQALSLGTLAVFSVVSTVSCGKDNLRADELEVFRTVVESDCELSSTDRFHAISDIPASASEFEGIPHSAPIPKDVLARIKARTENDSKWPHDEVCKAQRVVDGELVNRLIAESNTVPPTWKNFYAAFPGVIDLSHISLPVLSADRKQAFVLLHAIAENVSDSAYIYELNCLQGKWIIARADRLWIHSF